MSPTEVRGLAGLARMAGLVTIGWSWLGNAAVVVVAAAYLPELLGRKYFAGAGCEAGRAAAGGHGI